MAFCAASHASAPALMKRPLTFCPGAVEMDLAFANSARPAAGLPPMGKKPLPPIAHPTARPWPARLVATLSQKWLSQNGYGCVDQVYTSSYRRLVVCCGRPEHASQKADCRKRRNFGVRAASASGLDLMEPYAYLGAWLRAAALYEDAASHERYNPNEAAVKAYAAEQGWS